MVWQGLALVSEFIRLHMADGRVAKRQTPRLVALRYGWQKLGKKAKRETSPPRVELGIFRLTVGRLNHLAMENFLLFSALLSTYEVRHNSIRLNASSL